jgi:NADH:ubiquinone oxidoreductase subunit 6 (subunit J)
MIAICINKSAKDGKTLFKMVSGILGLYYLLLIVIVVIYMIINYFAPQPTQTGEDSSNIKSLIKTLTYLNILSLAFPVLMHLPTHPKRVI